MPDHDQVLVRWSIGRTGRAWTGEEAHQPWEMTPEKFEMNQGKLFWDDTSDSPCWPSCWRTWA